LKFKLFSLFVALVSIGSGQSTYGTIVGTVKDPSGSAVPSATVTLTNLDKNETLQAATNASGSYELLNILPAHYGLTVSAKGFETFSATNILLVSRQTLRIDAALQVGQISQSVTVNESEVGVVATDSQVIQETFTPQQLQDLPANVRAAGNTSPYNFLQALPGVQPDDSGNLSIQGGIPSQTQYSIDGISVTDVTGNSPLTNAFPSSESIAEIKVQGVGSPAEYGQVGDVTTVSKSGTNEVHGGLFWYTQNAALNAINYGSTEKPKLIANDFGATIGGPVIIPHLYNGKNKTFYFGTYEGFRYPQSSTVQDTVPTQAMRNGNFSAEGVTITNPITGQPYPNDTLPTSLINPVALKVLALFPLPTPEAQAAFTPPITW